MIMIVLEILAVAVCSMMILFAGVCCIFLSPISAIAVVPLLYITFKNTEIFDGNHGTIEKVHS
jgi:hypothetical protein